MGKCLFMRKGGTHTAPVTGILASDLAVGSSVYLIENGVAVEYLVVNQGIPSASSLYDASCDGLWLLRKDIYENRQWHSSTSNIYSASTIHTYLNDTFFNIFGPIEQNTIKQVKIPHIAGTSINSPNSGSNGLSTKVFLLSTIELGFTTGSSFYPNDGAKLSYFDAGNDTTALNKRMGVFNGSVTQWWLRSPHYGTGTGKDCTFCVWTTGKSGAPVVTSSYGVRPALVLPSTAVFDETTMLLKGVK